MTILLLLCNNKLPVATYLYRKAGFVCEALISLPSSNICDYYVWKVNPLPYSLNVSREKIFADFEVFDLPQKFYS